MLAQDLKTFHFLAPDAAPKRDRPGRSEATEGGYNNAGNFQEMRGREPDNGDASLDRINVLRTEQTG